MEITSVKHWRNAAVLQVMHSIPAAAPQHVAFALPTVYTGDK